MRDTDSGRMAERLRAILDEDGNQTGVPPSGDLTGHIDTRSLAFRAEGKVIYDRDLSERQHRNRSDGDRADAMAKLDRIVAERTGRDWVRGYLEGGDAPDLFGPVSVDYGRTCQTCGGRRRLRCTICQGQGSTRCPSCFDGRVTCTACGGSGKGKCHTCGGSGRIQQQNRVPVRNSQGGTDYVYRVEMVSCPGCRGSGYSGLCMHCQGGRTTCRTCGGRATVTCSACHGRGDVGCDSCGATGRENFTLTMTPRVEAEIDWICEEDQAAFDACRARVPGYTEQRAARYRKNLRLGSKGVRGWFSYGAIAHSASAGNGSDPAAILGNEEAEPLRSEAYLERLRAGTMEALEREDYGTLAGYPLGQEVVVTIRSREQSYGPLLKRFDPGYRLMPLIVRARDGLVAEVTRGEIREMVWLCGAAFLLAFVVMAWPWFGADVLYSPLRHAAILAPLYLPWAAWAWLVRSRDRRRRARGVEALGEEIELGRGSVARSALYLMGAQLAGILLDAFGPWSRICVPSHGVFHQAACGVETYFAVMLSVLKWLT